MMYIDTEEQKKKVMCVPLLTVLTLFYNVVCRPKLFLCMKGCNSQKFLLSYKTYESVIVFN